MRPLLALLIATAGVTACAPTCSESCRKVISCGVAEPTLSQDECVELCERQRLEVSETDVDEGLEKAFSDHRRCIGSATCEELEAGVCYDPELFAAGVL
ncbi:MAG: hypothetical protein ACON5B_14525 [Myxococcota bacterium]